MASSAGSPGPIVTASAGTGPGCGAAANVRSPLVVVRVIGWEEAATPARRSVTVPTARSQRRTSSPPAKRATERPSSITQVQSPGVIGVSRQSRLARGVIGVGVGAGGAGAGVGGGAGAGITRLSAQDADSVASVTTARRKRGRAEGARKRRFAFIATVWNLSRSATTPGSQ